MNKVLIVGNLTRDPEHSQTSGGVSLAKFSIAVNRTFTNANGEKETDFFNVITWRALADNCAKFLAKGRKVAICGALQTASYTDKDGIKRYRTDIVADEVEFLNSLQKGDNGAPEPIPPPSKKAIGDLAPSSEEGLPF